MKSGQLSEYLTTFWPEIIQKKQPERAKHQFVYKQDNPFTNR
jgi:hypothetical protein